MPGDNRKGVTTILKRKGLSKANSQQKDIKTFQVTLTFYRRSADRFI
jgi:hypothetical protein